MENDRSGLVSVTFVGVEEHRGVFMGFAGLYLC